MIDRRSTANFVHFAIPYPLESHPVAQLQHPDWEWSVDGMKGAVGTTWKAVGTTSNVAHARNNFFGFYNLEGAVSSVLQCCMDRIAGGRQQPTNKFTASESKKIIIARIQLGDGWPSPVGETNKHCPRNTGEASDSCKFLGQRCYCRPVVHAWVYSAWHCITTPSDND